MSYVLTLNCHQNVVYTGSYSTEENKQPLDSVPAVSLGPTRCPEGLAKSPRAKGAGESA